MKRFLWCCLLLIGGCSTVPVAPPEPAVPVLMYHRIVQDGEPLSDMNVSITEFKKHLSWLKDNGYVAITAFQASDWLYDKKYVAITFDDGWKSQLLAVDALKEAKMRATFFIIAGSTSPVMMSWDDIKAIATDEEFEIGNHSMSHKSILKEEDAEIELLLSKQLIERHIGREVKTLSWPNGYYTPQLVTKAKLYQYKAAFTIEEAWPDKHVGNRQLDDRYEAKRIYIDGRCSVEEFAQIVSQMHSMKCGTK